MTRFASPTDPYRLANQAADALRRRGFGDHDVLVVLGSGWKRVVHAFGDLLQVAPMSEVVGFHPPVAEGHGSEIHSYSVGSRRVLALLGRTHLYEGRGAAAVVHSVRTAAALGCRTALLTNANGSFRFNWSPGTCVLISDHLNLTATSPLVGPRFVDLTDAYSPHLRELALRAHPGFVEGVYAMLPGPHYETRAEAKGLAQLGADVVGMSTVLETIAAREAKLDVLALSMVTVTEGLDQGIDPAVVVETAKRAATRLAPAITRIISQLNIPAPS